MKKFALIMLVLFFSVSFISTDLFAKGIGLKLGYSQMRDDYSSPGHEFEDAATFGIYADMGPFLFEQLVFRPGINYIELESENEFHNKWWDMDVYALHLDWYWMFMGKQSISPFLGFGFALNYLSWHENNNEDDDSDAGIELFAGADFALSGPLSLMLEVRYVMHDFSNRDQNMLQGNLGILYSF